MDGSGAEWVSGYTTTCNLTVIVLLLIEDAEFYHISFNKEAYILSFNQVSCLFGEKGTFYFHFN